MDRSPAQRPQKDDGSVETPGRRAALRQARGLLAARPSGRRLSDELVAERRAQAHREDVVPPDAA